MALFLNMPLNMNNAPLSTIDMSGAANKVLSIDTTTGKNTPTRAKHPQPCFTTCPVIVIGLFHILW